MQAICYCVVSCITFCWIDNLQTSRVVIWRHTIWAGCWYVVCGLYFCRAALWEAYIAWKEWGMVYLKLWVANLVMLAIPINGYKLVASLSVCHMVSNPRSLLICALIFFWFDIFLKFSCNNPQFHSLLYLFSVLYLTGAHGWLRW